MTDLLAQLRTAQAAVSAVRGLHVRRSLSWSASWHCCLDGEVWPCSTIRALDNAATAAEEATP